MSNLINWVITFTDESKLVFQGVDCPTAASEYATYRADLRGSVVASVQRASFQRGA